MPTVPQGGKVLVSGANGYIAMWTVQKLLERGYSVRGTVRSADKGQFMSEYFAKLGYGGAIEFVIVEDIVKDGAFDGAIKDVDAIAHMASPFHYNVSDPQEFFKPAIQGTVGILKSALKNAKRVKRIVITSSCASVVTPNLSEPRVFSEKDWNEASPKEVEELGSKTPPSAIYRASKVLAEKAAWEFYNQHKSQVQWDLSVINPPFVFGPPIHDVTSVKSMNTSLQLWYDMVVSDSPKTKEALSQTIPWVDVRDTALAHVLALEKEAAGGERIITTSGPSIWQEWLDVANSLNPNPLPSHKLAVGHPEIVGEKVYLISYDKAKEERILGIKFSTRAEIAKATLEDFARRGW